MLRSRGRSCISGLPEIHRLTRRARRRAAECRHRRGCSRPPTRLVCSVATGCGWPRGRPYRWPAPHPAHGPCRLRRRTGRKGCRLGQSGARFKPSLIWRNPKRYIREAFRRADRAVGRNVNLFAVQTESGVAQLHDESSSMAVPRRRRDLCRATSLQVAGSKHKVPPKAAS